MEIAARAAYRGQITKIARAATEFLKAEESQITQEEGLEGIEEEIMQFIQRLTAAHKSLKTINEEIREKDLLKAEDVIKEFEKIAEYEDIAIGVLARLNSRLNKLQKKQTPTTTGSDEHHGTSNVNICSLKLPKLSLKKFDGNFQDWLPFWEQFRTAVHENNSLSPTDKFSYLESVLHGNAKKVIAGFTASEKCYEAAVALLEEQFGDTERLVDKYIQQLVSLRPIHTRTDTTGLRNLYNTITACSRSLTALQIPTHQYYIMLKSILLRCLPTELRIDYHRTAEKDNESDTSLKASCSSLAQIGDEQVHGILRFLKREVESLEKSRVVSLAVGSKSTPSTTATSLLSQDEKNVCVFCSSDKHTTRDCNSGMSITEKRDKLRASGRCFRCAKKGHSSKTCRCAKYITCTKCTGKHMTTMCDPSFGKSKAAAATNSETCIKQSATSLCACNSILENSSVFLKTARGIVAAPNKDKVLVIRFVIDGGSQHSYIREDVALALELAVVGEVNISVVPFGSKSRSPYQKLKKVKINIRSQYSNRSVDIEAIAVPEICIDMLPTPDNSCSAFRGLRLADHQHAAFEPQDGLSALIGSDYYWSIVTGKQRRISPNLRAVDTIFGWTLQGPHTLIGKNVVSNVNLCSSLLNSSSESPNVLNDDTMTAFWSLEAIGIQSCGVENEKLAVDLIRNCISRKGLRYQATLPWKDKHVSTENNRDSAIVRLNSLIKRLSRTPGRLDEYDRAIRQMVLEGVAEPVIPNQDDGPRRIFYLPHRPVYKAESKTTKMRIVFDASHRTEDHPSLNDQLHVGANLLPEILKVLLNFRLGRFGIVADVEKAFLQILLSKVDRDSHRFVWRSSNSSITAPKFEDFRMTRVTFGINCSPFLLAATLRLHFINEEHRFPSTSNILRNSFYMDDLVISVDEEEEGKRICKEAVEIMGNASMNLRKWNSNSAVIREAVGTTESEAIQKVLGLIWFVFSDELAVSFQNVDFLILNSARPTKRIVLQTIARIFDPLGMFGPIIIRLKILFQAIWKEKTNWDEAINTELLFEWEGCVKSLLQLKDVTIPRSALGISSPGTIHIHIFADASMKAYGTVAYIKNVSTTGKSWVSFLCAKNRVAPLKQDKTKELTLPKLELTAALIAARLCIYLKQSLKVSVDKFYMWTDSRIALSWIHGEASKWNPYVQSRVLEIRRYTSISDWNHCAGKENPADLLTRGITTENLHASSLWAHGPAWLNDNNKSVYEDTPANLDKVAALALLTETTSQDLEVHHPLVRFEDFSSWKRLLWVTGYILRFVSCCKKKTRPSSRRLSTDELNAAEFYWLRYIQFLEFPNERLLLQKGEPLPAGSKIAQLTPFLDNEGLMRLGGRLQSLEDAFSFKHPIILPMSFHLTSLIIEDYHQRSLHGGVNIVLSELRSRFWIPKGRQVVKKVLKRCVICQKLWGRPASQPFGPLPIERLTLTRPFDNVGVDFAGPLYSFNVTNGDMDKIYLMIFTCAAVRAVHLEIVRSLSTESCLMGLRRFIARRGVPSTIFSDNARTFRRAALDLEGRTINNEEFQSFMSNRRIRWKFIVERAPWWGGFWERLIRSIKNVLKVVIGKAKLSFEQIRTIIAEAEGIINARPLTYVSSNPLDVAPLTPAHFLANKDNFLNLEGMVPETTKLHNLWQQRLKYTRMLWNRWRLEYMQLLRSFHHINPKTSRQLKEKDVVVVFDSGKPRIHWKLAVIEETFRGRDGKVRACEIRYSDGTRTRRPVQLLYPLELAVSSPPGGC